MRDIKLTLSTDTSLRAPNAAAEARWLKEAGDLAYPIPFRPLSAGVGSWVYFISDGLVVARAKISDIKNLTQSESSSRVTYTGANAVRPGWSIIVTPPLQLANHSVSHRGFQSFRYVTPSEAGLAHRLGGRLVQTDQEGSD